MYYIVPFCFNRKVKIFFSGDVGVGVHFVVLYLNKIQDEGIILHTNVKTMP